MTEGYWNNLVGFVVRGLLAAGLAVGLLGGCREQGNGSGGSVVRTGEEFGGDAGEISASAGERASWDAGWSRPRSDERIAERRRMVGQIGRYGLDDAQSLDAVLNVPRHWFVGEANQRLAYADTPLAIGHGQTISQPFIVAYMTSVLRLDEDKKVLEIGTGSGYQAAVLSEITPHVYSIEIVEPLGIEARERLESRGYGTIKLKIGDGYKGWDEHQPFDAIIVTCAPDDIPPPLIEQLKSGGTMVIPVGGAYGIQDLIVVTKDAEGTVSRESMMPVRFVPMLRERER